MPEETAESAAARRQVLSLVSSKIVSRVVWVLAKVGVADVLAEGSGPVEMLARRTGCDTESLYRIMRCATAFGVFQELPGRCFALTAAAEQLRSGPEGIRDLVLMNGDDTFWQPYGEILHTVRTGETGFQRAFGMPFFDYLDKHADAADQFHRAMAVTNAEDGAVFTDLVDLSGFSRVADLGGGGGAFLADVLDHAPECTGLLLDRPEAVQSAARLFTERGLSHRTDMAVGSFLNEVPGGCDAYVLKHVLHDFNDELAGLILSRVRQAMGRDRAARLFVLERVVRPPGPPDPAWVFDVEMMMVLGGHERTAPEWQELTRRAGLELTGTISSERAISWSVLVCAPAEDR